VGSKERRHGQEGTTTALRAGDSYGQAEHRLMGYDRAAITHKKKAFQIQEEFHLRVDWTKG
jgi:hypothetical protein